MDRRVDRSMMLTFWAVTCYWTPEHMQSSNLLVVSLISLYRNDVENHRVQWDQDFNFSCKMYANVDGVLEPCWCKISIRKVNE